MPKRALDTGPADSMSSGRSQKKTERSHEENQERAYIAASRRADRSIEARVQSARMASEIHKKRTGKGFKISEEIVMKEEMYEEEDDDLPRQYRALAAHLQTSSAEMNHRLTAYLSNQVAMASWARQQEVNRMFAEQFPNAGRVSQQLSQSAYMQPLQGVGYPGSPRSPMSPTQGGQAPEPARVHARSQPVFSQPSPSSPSSVMSPGPGASTIKSPPAESSGKAFHDGDMSPPGLTPTSLSAEPMRTNAGTQHELPAFLHQPSAAYHTPPSGSATADPALGGFSPMPPTLSSFTAELPAEAKLMANIDMNDPLASIFFGGSGDPMGIEGLDPMGMGAVFGQFSQSLAAAPQSMFAPVKSQQQQQQPHQPAAQPAQTDDYFSAGTQFTSKLLDVPGEQSTIGTPGGGEGDAWDSWVDTEQWTGLEPNVR